MSWEHSAEQAKVIAPAIVEIYKIFYEEALRQGFSDANAMRIALESVRCFFAPDEDDFTPPRKRR